MSPHRSDSGFVAALAPVVALLAAFAAGAGCDSAKRSGATGPVRVAAVGDSITFGGGGDDAYPAQLAKLLGAGYDVANFGLPGATAAEGGDLPYVQQPACRAARAYAPDIAIIMLGTNDTKAHNWPHRSAFSADLSRLVRTFRELPSRPRIVLALPPPVFQRDPLYIDGDRLQALLPMIRAVATEAHTPIIDLQRALSNKANLLPDNIHPNPEGNALIAHEIRNTLVHELGITPQP